MTRESITFVLQKSKACEVFNKSLIMPCNKEYRKNDSKFLNIALCSLSLVTHASVMLFLLRCRFAQNNLQQNLFDLMHLIVIDFL